jgi:hypothetical protein
LQLKIGGAFNHFSSDRLAIAIPAAPQIGKPVLENCRDPAATALLERIVLFVRTVL